MALLPGTAMALSGGGAPAAGFGIGFSLAWEVLLLSHSILDIEHFSGVSAGSIGASYWASGISPFEVARAQVGQPSPVLPIERDDFYAVNWEEIAPALRRLPQVAARLARSLVGRGPSARFELIRSILPSSMFVGRRVERVLCRNLTASCGDRFENLQRRLTIRLFDIRSGLPLLWGDGGDTELPVSRAIRASITFPVLYNPFPVEMGNTTMLALDGGTDGTTFELRSFGKRDVVIVLDATSRGVAEREHTDLLEVAQLALQNVFHHRNRGEIVDYINGNRTTHVLYFTMGRATRELSFLSYEDAFRAVRLGFEITRDRLAEILPYLRLVFAPHGVTLNSEIGSADFDEAVGEGPAYKERVLRALLGGAAEREAG